MKSKKTEPTDSTAIERYGMSMGDIGKNLIEAARQAEQKAIIERATSEVTNLNRMIDHATGNIAKAQVAVAIYKLRLSAIAAGKFTLSNQGTIVYNESKLNEVV